MSNTNRLLAVLVVGIMLAAGLVCVVDCSEADDSKIVTSDSPMVIDVNGTYEDNKDAFNALGIGRSAWTWDETYECNRLVLRDVDLTVNGSNAMVFVSKSTASNPTVVVELKGENYVTVNTSNTTSVKTGAIKAIHEVNGQIIKDIKMIIAGDGYLGARCVGSPSTVLSSIAIDVFGTLAMTDSAIVYAYSAPIVYYQEATTETDEKKFFSIGVEADYLFMAGAKGNMPVINATGNSIDVTFVDKCPESKVFVAISSGIRCGEYNVDWGGIIGYGGLVKWSELAEGNVGAFNAQSCGIDTMTTSAVSNKITLKNVLARGVGGNVLGLRIANSYGVYLCCDEGSTISIDDSIILGNAGNIAITGGTSPSTTCGIALDEKTVARNSLFYGTAGPNAFGPSDWLYAWGISLECEVSFNGCILCGISEASHCEFSYGIHVLDSKKVMIRDTDIFASGHKGCVDDTIIIPSGYIFFNSVDYKGDVTPLSGNKITEDIRTVEMAYKYDVLYFGTTHVVYYERLTNNSLVLGDYKGPVMPGYEFDHWVVNGVPVQIGETVTLTGITYVEGVFVPVDDKTGDNGDSSWIVWLAIAIVLIAIVALIGSVCYFKAR